MASKTVSHANMVSNTGPITVLEQKANYSDAVKIAAQNGGRLPTLKEFIIQLKTDKSLLEKTGMDEVWLGDDPGLKIVGRDLKSNETVSCKIDYKNGVLTPVASEAIWEALPDGKRAEVSGGSGHFVLLVDCITLGGPEIRLQVMHERECNEIVHATYPPTPGPFEPYTASVAYVAASK